MIKMLVCSLVIQGQTAFSSITVLFIAVLDIYRLCRVKDSFWCWSKYHSCLFNIQTGYIKPSIIMLFLFSWMVSQSCFDHVVTLWTFIEVHLVNILLNQVFFYLFWILLSLFFLVYLILTHLICVEVDSSLLFLSLTICSIYHSVYTLLHYQACVILFTLLQIMNTGCVYLPFVHRHLNNLVHSYNTFFQFLPKYLKMFSWVKSTRGFNVKFAF